LTPAGGGDARPVPTRAGTGRLCARVEGIEPSRHDGRICGRRGDRIDRIDIDSRERKRSARTRGASRGDAGGVARTTGVETEP
jgi:hypothetical protein